MTVKLIATVTVGSTPSAVQFNSIPQIFDDLLIVHSIRSSAVTSNPLAMTMVINGTSSGSRKGIAGNGSAAFGVNDTGPLYAGTFTGTTSTANTFGSGRIYIPNYKSNEIKTINTFHVFEQNATAADIGVLSLSSSTLTAITSLAFGDGSSGLGYGQHTTISLYGIKAGSDGSTVVA